MASCPVCRHPERDAIDALLDDDPDPTRLIAELFGLHPRTVDRHDRLHRDATTNALAAEAGSVRLPELDAFDPTRVRLTGLRPAEWSVEPACAGQASRELDPWHAEDESPRADQRAALELAREVCSACPVRAQCLALGLALIPLGDVWGVYAGLTPQELRQVARDRGMPQRTVAQHGTRARRVAGCDCAACKRAHAEYVAKLRAEERYAETDRRKAPSTSVRTSRTDWERPVEPVDLDRLGRLLERAEPIPA